MPEAVRLGRSGGSGQRRNLRQAFSRIPANNAPNAIYLTPVLPFFGDKTGAILADGLFVLESKGPATPAELRYAALRDRTIFLVDARTLSLLLASDRDPSNRRIIDSLKSISSGGGGQPVDCGKTPTNNPDEKAGECAVQAFESRRPFYVR